MLIKNIKAFPRDSISQIEINPVTIGFLGEYKHLEPVFLAENSKRSGENLRYAAFLGIFLYSVFGILDAYLVPDKKEVLWFIRFAVVIPFLVLLIICSFFPFYKKHSQVFHVFVHVLAGAGISVMVALAPPPASFSYYAGVILVLMLGYGYSRTRFIWAALAGWLNVAVYEIIAVGVVHTPGLILLNNNFFFISANIIGMFSSYAMEYYSRRDFLMTRMLHSAREEGDELNRDLEQKIRERTLEIQKVNDILVREIEAKNHTEKQRKNLEQKLYHARKMESIGNLAGGIAHDFNNILSSILGFTELSLDIVQKETMLEDNLLEIYKAGERAAEMVRQILAFARQSDEAVKPVKVEIIIREVLKLIRSTIPSTIEMKTSLQSGSLIMGNTTQVHQIFMNLCANSAYAMKNTGGTLELTLKDLWLEPAADDRNTYLPQGEYVEIQVSDTGEGIKPEVIGRIFEPYFTTKNTGEGTGMGLAMVHGIVESYGGRITVSSTPGQGSVFTILLPVTHNKEISRDSEDNELPGGTERILIVDDEEAIVKSGSLILSGLGYRVTSMTSSSEAWNLFQQNPYEYDLIITDLTMPVMDGEKLALKIATVRQNLPVILCTGYSKIKPDKSGSSSNILAYAYKPLSRAELAKLVRKALDR